GAMLVALALGPGFERVRCVASLLLLASLLADAGPRGALRGVLALVADPCGFPIVVHEERRRRLEFEVREIVLVPGPGGKRTVARLVRQAGAEWLAAAAAHEFQRLVGNDCGVVAFQIGPLAVYVLARIDVRSLAHLRGPVIIAGLYAI